MGVSGEEEVRTTSETPSGETGWSAKDVIWKLTAVIVVFILVVIFVMIGMKLAWIGG